MHPVDREQMCLNPSAAAHDLQHALWTCSQAEHSKETQSTLCMSLSASGQAHSALCQTSSVHQSLDWGAPGCTALASSMARTTWRCGILDMPCLTCGLPAGTLGQGLPAPAGLSASLKQGADELQRLHPDSTPKPGEASKNHCSSSRHAPLLHARLCCAGAPAHRGEWDTWEV